MTSLPAGAGDGRTIARALSAAFALTLAACGGRDTPTAPSPPQVAEDWTHTPLEWSAERYYLEIAGSDLSEDPSLPPCDPILMPPGGKFVNTFLWFAWDGEELVGRSRPPYRATVEMRLRRVSSSILGVAIMGTVTGSVPDEYDRAWGQRDSIFNVDGTMTMQGVVPPRAATDQRGPVLGGLLRGPGSFIDSRGAIAFCTNVRYFLQPAPPGSVHDDPTVPPLVPGARGERAAWHRGARRMQAPFTGSQPRLAAESWRWALAEWRPGPNPARRTRRRFVTVP